MHAAARLEHPNIVTAHDAGEAHGVHFLVMQYVDGRDLASLVAERGPLPVAKAVDYVLQAARGLAYAHAKGVIHRDIKPANLLLSNEGTVKILDMGIARLDDVSPSPGQPADDRVRRSDGHGRLHGARAGRRRARRRRAGRRLQPWLHALFFVDRRAALSGLNACAETVAHRAQPIPSLVQRRGGRVTGARSACSLEWWPSIRPTDFRPCQK